MLPGRHRKTPYESLRDHVRRQLRWADAARLIRPDVFNDLHHWSGLKLFSLQYYVVMYSTILPDFLKFLRKDQMVYVDILAGAGLNRIAEAGDFLPGSTIIAAEAPSKKFDYVLALENDPDRSAALTKRLAQVRPRQSFEVIPYDAEWHADTITGFLEERNAHYLAFIDYEGLGGFSWQSMESLLEHSGDLFITFLPGWARVAGRAWDADIKKLQWLVGPELASSARNLDGLFTGYVDQIKDYRENVIDIPIRSGGSYEYELIFAARETRGKSPWLRGVEDLRSHLLNLTADDVVRAIREIRAEKPT